jgi:hypothetical protein
VAARARVALRQKIGDRRSEIGKAVALSQNYRFVNKVGMGNRRAAGVGRKGAARQKIGDRRSEIGGQRTRWHSTLDTRRSTHLLPQM